MSTLQVNIREPDATVKRFLSKLIVYSIVVTNPKTHSYFPYSGKLISKNGKFGTGYIKAIASHPNYDGRNKGATIQVNAVSDSHDIVLNSSVLRVYSTVQPVIAVVKPVDLNQINVDAGTVIPLNRVDLDLAVSFDTYFDFNMRSLEGIKSVVDENDNEVGASLDDKYQLNTLVPGQALRRTILTSSGFRVALNIRPTIVKSSTG